uniref:Dystroglycan 1 n=1 Tax=Anopheles dirus TaxID=7168 RepID=A0A182NMI6_9DIPT
MTGHDRARAVALLIFTLLLQALGESHLSRGDDEATASSSTVKSTSESTEKASTAPMILSASFESSSSPTPITTSATTTTSTTTSTTTTHTPSSSTPAADTWNSEMEEEDESLEVIKQFDDEVDSKSSPFARSEYPATSTTGSSLDRDDRATVAGLDSFTTVSSVPLTTAKLEEMDRYAANDRSRFGMPPGEEDTSEEGELEEEDIEEDEEDYFSQGVRITVLPPNLPPLHPRAREDPVPASTLLTPRTTRPAGLDRDDAPINPTEPMASPATTTTPVAATVTAATDSSTVTMTARQNQDTFTTTTPPTSAYYIPTTVIASTTTTNTPSKTTTTTTTATASFFATTTTTSAAPASNPSTTLAPEPDTVATSTTLELQPTTTQRSGLILTTPKQNAAADAEKEVEYENYDEEYDDEEEEGGAQEITTISTLPAAPRLLPSSTERTPATSTEASTVPSTTTTEATTPSTTSTTTTSTTVAYTTTTEAPTTTTSTTTPATTTTEAATTTTPSTVLTTELDEPTNLPPTIRNRIPKQAIPAGKVFRYQVPLETFYDNEDGNNLRLELLDSRDQPLKPNSWMQFNEDTKEIYGLPLEKDVSRWAYKLRATDSGNLTVTEKVDIMVQQHKSHRSLNHEISLALRLNRKFTSNVDWHIETARGISGVLGDVTLTNIIVRDIRYSIQDPSLATFVYTNETLPKDRCPEEKLDELVALLTEEALNDALNPDITVKSVQGQQIAQCTKPTLPKAKPTQSISRNMAPQTRNQVDQVNATVGHLLVFKVPVDTFFDNEDGNELKMKLLTTERHTLDPYHWLQFDSKNQEFYGVPRTTDIGRKEYLLMAEDREGLTATDALVVVVNPHHKRDYSVLFELTLDITHEQFSTAQVQRRFIERLAQVFGDASTHFIKIHHIRPIHHTGQVQVSFFNTTLNRQHQRCPQEEIEALRNILLHQDSTIRAKVREILGQEFSLQNVSLVPLDNCHGFDTPHHATSEPEKAAPKPISKDDYMLTFVLPTVIILVMLLFASVIACVLYKRRLTGKMELGTDEERKSFRSKGIPVIFQDELDEKPEIGNKSPVILKDEKPPLLPPSYSSTNNDGENEDVDEYVPPQPVIVGGRESRGKSPVTPSYRRPPPYVSP